MEDICNRLKKLRKLRHMTQEAFGAAIGLTGAAISRLESGERELSDATIKHISKAFRISESWLRTGEGEMEDRDVISDLIATYNLGPAGQAFMRAIGRILYELGEDACNKVIEDVLAELQVGVANRQSASVSLPQAPAEEEGSSSASSGSVVG